MNGEIDHFNLFFDVNALLLARKESLPNVSGLF